ncbi:recombinase family protein [Streptomyces sp. NPDC048188]|uniref:recombinase family protein n=1 Tax=Streptomyces sp. NPDC048188 TaxID=3155749 RepID=UPI003412975B
MTTTAQRIDTATAREYLRVSKGRGRTARSITDQHTENVTAVLEHGPWTLGEPYRDTGSASKYATRTRDDFERLMADLQAGAFGEPGDVLVLWEISRLARETGRGVALIDACEAGSYLIHITSHERTYNPANYQDRHSLISGINDAEKEARLLSARTRRGINSAAREGRPHGRVPFGYAREYQVIDGKPRAVRQYPHPTEGPLIRELFERVAGVDGKMPEPIYAIAKDWKARGIWIPEKTVSGEHFASRPYTPEHLRAFLVRPVYAGLRRFKGQMLPEWEGMEAVVPRELFDRVQALLADPSRTSYHGTGMRWVLSGTLRCDVCDGPMHVKLRSRVPGYECKHNACARVSQVETDRLLIGDPETGELGLILAYLSDPERYARLLRSAADGTEEESALRAELADLRTELEELEAAPRPKTARARIQRTADMEELEQDIATRESQLVKLTARNPLEGVLPTDPGADLVSWWKAADVQRQRAVAALLLTPDVLGQVRVTRAPNRKPIPVAERLRRVRTV